MVTKKAPATVETRLSGIEKQLEALIGRLRPNVDPSPEDLGHLGGWPAWAHIPIPISRLIPTNADPVPIDISRLSKAQLQLSLESINAQRIRLDAVESMLRQHIK